MLRHPLLYKLSNTTFFAAGLFVFLLNQAPNAVGQVPKNAEKVLARQIVCEQFVRDPDDGSWLGGPHAMIGTSDFANTKFEPKGIKINGIPVSELLDRKCKDTARSTFVADACDVPAWRDLPVLRVSHAEIDATPSVVLNVQVVAGFGQ